jgi:hypothetical protein
MSKHDEWIAEKSEQVITVKMSEAGSRGHAMMFADEVREYLAALDAENEKLWEAVSHHDKVTEQWSKELQKLLEALDDLDRYSQSAEYCGSPTAKKVEQALEKDDERD